MKIYVNKLPKNCFYCPLHVSSLIDNEDFCSVNGVQISNDEFFCKRAKFCPLVEKDIDKIERELRIAQEGNRYLKRKVEELKEKEGNNE